MLNIESAFPYICKFFALSNSLREKIHMICIFAVNLIFLLALGHVVNKMCVSHGNKNGFYFLHFNFLNMTDDRFVKSYKSPAFHPKKRIVALQKAPENPKNVCSSVCKSQNV